MNSRSVLICLYLFLQGTENIYHHHHHPEKKKSERISGAIDPYGRYGNAGKTSKTISTIAILWPVKAVFEKRAAMVVVDIFISTVSDRTACQGPVRSRFNDMSSSHMLDQDDIATGKDPANMLSIIVSS